MHPELLNITWLHYNFTIKAYSFFIVLAAVSVTGLGLCAALGRGLPKKRAALCLVAMGLAAPLGARLLHLATNPQYYAMEPSRILSLHAQGFSLYGGLLAAALTGLVTCRALSINAWRMADAMAPAMGVGIAFMRVGCYLNGCCYGKVTTLPWGVTFPLNSPAAGKQLSGGFMFFLQGIQPVHPTQLYEMLAALVGTGLAALILRRKAPDGAAFLTFILWFTAFRWLNSYLRVSATTLNVPEYFYPFFYSLILLLALGLLLGRLKSATMGHLIKREAG